MGIIRLTITLLNPFYLYQVHCFEYPQLKRPLDLYYSCHLLSPKLFHPWSLVKAIQVWLPEDRLLPLCRMVVLRDSESENIHLFIYCSQSKREYLPGPYSLASLATDYEKTLSLTYLIFNLRESAHA